MVDSDVGGVDGDDAGGGEDSNDSVGGSDDVEVVKTVMVTAMDHAEDGVGVSETTMVLMMV